MNRNLVLRSACRVVLVLLALFGLSACLEGGSGAAPLERIRTSSIGGTVSGLTGKVVLQNNSGNDAAVLADGTFTFPKPVVTGESYAVTVRTQPAGQLCTVSNGSGAATADVTSVAVVCVNAYRIGGIVSGLNGMVVLQSNGGNDVVVSEDGEFQFTTLVVAGEPYVVTVRAQPAGQICEIGSGAGTSMENVTAVTVSCVNSHSIGGTVSGVSGMVVLQNNGGNDVTVSASGTFTFATPVASGESYSVTVLAHPVGQFCVVDNGSGTVVANISTVEVNCVKAYSVGGTVSGLSGTVVLQNNGGNGVAVSANGAFKFTALVPQAGNYAVAVRVQPAGQFCAVTNGAGTAMANVNTVAVSCVSAYSVGGTITGLTGALVLQNNGGNDAAISADGAFSFAVPKGAAYALTVRTQPAGQRCTVTNGTGKATANVSTVTVGCVNAYSIGGTISGLTGTLVLQNNFGNDVTVSASGTFAFGALVVHGGSFVVTAWAQPVGQVCAVTSGTGTATAKVNSVAVTCRNVPVLNLSAGVKQLSFSWSTIPGAAYFKFMENRDGVSGYTQLGGNLTGTSTTVDIAVFRHDWGKVKYMVSACNSSDVCTDSSEVSTLSEMLKAIAYFKASNTGAYDAFGASVAVSADGSTLAVGAPSEASTTTGINSAPNDSGEHVGAVYVFTRSAGTWNQQAYVKASNAGSGDQFGASVALSADGNTLAVGAWREASSTTGVNSTPNDAAPYAGAVYVFSRNGSDWSQQGYVKGSNTGEADLFGGSVALSADGSILAVGVAREDSSTTGINSTPNELMGDVGAVYVFTRTAGTWGQQAYVKADHTGISHLFGVSVALSADGNTLAVGAQGEPSSTTGLNSMPNEAATNAGAAYVFIRSGGSWRQQAYVKAFNSGAYDAFGASIALSADGNTLAVGAYGEGSDTTGVNSSPNEYSRNAGAVYVFTRSASNWSQQAYVKASNSGYDDFFGNSAALSADGNTLVVGAWGEGSATTGINSAPNNNTNDAGAVYVFTRSASNWSQQAYVKASNSDYYDFFGKSVALTADGNTLAVGANGEDGSAIGFNSVPNEAGYAAEAGAVYLY